MLTTVHAKTTASPKKLRDGSWGALTHSTVAKGDRVQIQTKAGKTWIAEVTKVIWSGDGKCIVATHSLDSGNYSGRSNTRYVPRRANGCRECGGPVRHAPHCRAMNGYCGECAYDLF